jgi:hypothetical protein
MRLREFVKAPRRTIVGTSLTVKVSYSAGVVVRTGTDFRTLAVGWQWLWFRP